MENKINIERYAPKIATYIFTEVTTNTTSGTWCVSFEEIQSYYGVDLEKEEELLEAIKNHLNTDFGNFIADFEVYDNQFDVNLWTNYCVNNVDLEDELWGE